eukprot:7744567-Heterocapsa_arctica.AAC.1
MERRSLRQAQEQSMATSKSQRQDSQHRRERSSSSEGPRDGRKRGSAGSGGHRTWGLDRVKGPKPPDPLAACEGGDRGGMGAPLGRLVR